MVKALIRALEEIGEDEKVVFLIADDIEVYSSLKEKYPSRTYNIGIAECNGISLAAGLENCGFVPFVIGGDSFMAFRALDFIRMQVSMQKSNVKIIGIGAGLAISVLGNTQHGTEDLSVLRAIPNLKVVTPGSPTEVYESIVLSKNEIAPTFFRIGRSTGVDYYSNGYKYEANKVQTVIEGCQLIVFSTGSILCDVISAIKGMKENIGVVNVHTVSPLDVDSIKTIAKKCSKWVSIEEHNLNGGLGSALAEVIVDYNLDVKLRRVGLNNQYANGYGSYDEIKRKNGLGIDDIAKTIRGMLS